MKIDGVLCVRRYLQEQDIPSEIADIIVQSRRPEKSAKYDIHIFKRVQFCSERNFSPYETTINQILLFLYDLFQSGVGCSVMNTARSSLSTSNQLSQNTNLGDWNCYYIHFRNRHQ